jgi:hypothetical protein
VKAGRLRLTRRGRIVAFGVAALMIAGISLAAADVAQATSHAPAASKADKGLGRVVVRPGQSLWSIAEAVDPGADTRVVIREIIELNALAGQVVVPGQRVWVPEG